MTLKVPNAMYFQRTPAQSADLASKLAFELRCVVNCEKHERPLSLPLASLESGTIDGFVALPVATVAARLKHGNCWMAVQKSETVRV